MNHSLPGSKTRCRRTSSFVLLGSLAFAVLGCGTEDPADQAFATTEDSLTRHLVVFDYSMPRMFGNDFDNDGIIDLQPVKPSDAALSPVVGNWVRPQAYKVVLDACASEPAVNYTWTVTLPTGTVRVDAGASCITTAQIPRQGTYPVALTATYREPGQIPGSFVNAPVTVRGNITVKNYLVVSVGDSIASGEGTPDVEGVRGQLWPNATISEPRWSDRRCHRSANSGHARAALDLENSDEHSSVTFISLACSGASIATGLLGSYAGQEPSSDTLPPLPPQIDEARRLTCPSVPSFGTPPPCPTIDALLMTVGANDLGFGDIVKTCATPSDTCSEGPLINVNEDLLPKLGALPALYDQLAARIKQRLPVKQVYVAEYQDPTHSDDGQYCNELVLPGAVADAFSLPGPFGGDIAPDGNIDHTDVVWAHKNLIAPLNARLLAAAQRNGWKPVVGITDEFKKHGYCANDRWIVRYEESKNRQINQDGTMHPNVAGHIAMGRHIAASLLEDTTLARSRLAALAPPTNNNVYVFGRTATDTVQLNVFGGAAWTGWTSLGGSVSSAPVAVEPAAFQVMVLAVDKNGALSRNTWSQEVQRWTGFRPLMTLTNQRGDVNERLEIRVVDTPAVARGRNGMLHIVAIGGDGRLWHKPFTPGTRQDDYNGVDAAWRPTNSPPFTGRPSIVANGPNEIDVVVRGAEHDLLHGWMNAGVWGWESFGNFIIGNPKITSATADRLDIFAIGGDNQLWHQWWARSWGWGGWERFDGGNATSDPDVVVWGVDQDDMFVRSRSLGATHLVYGGAWSPLALPSSSSPLTLTSGVSAAVSRAGVEDAFAELSDGSIVNWALRNGAWKATSLGRFR